MAIRERAIVFLAVCFSLCSFSACGGGGGGGGGENDGEQLRRASNTALRIIHGSIDARPVSIRIEDEEGGKIIQSAHYAQPKFYVDANEGPQIIRIEHQNDPTQVIARFDTELANDTEYTLFVYGLIEDRSQRVALLEDIAVAPEESENAFFQVLNAVSGYDSVSVAVDGKAFSTVTFGTTSGFSELTAGPHTVTVDSDSGARLAAATIEILEKGEATLLVTGSRDLGVTFIPVYPDLD